MLEGIIWYHHATISFNRDGKCIYIDPWKLPSDSPPADVILITHEHFDNYSPEDIDKIWKDTTKLVVPQSMFGKVKHPRKYVLPGDKFSIDDVHILVTPAYNKKKKFHPKSSKWVGYILKFGDTVYYHPGDTDFIPEMKNYKVDVLFLPVGGTYTMNYMEAIQAANTIKPNLVVPIHFDDLAGDESDALRFSQGYEGKSKILVPGKMNE